jgi:hypothetical protein
MTSPLTFPICWEPSRIEKAISIKAKLDEKQTDYFLACHSPIRQLRDVRAKQDKQVLDEEQLYKRMIKSNQRDVQGVIFGDAGTGKSHLIHWLKLRADDGLRRGELKDAVTILIERKSGSLKDALEQLIQQLVHSCGKDFERHLAPVQAAFSRISETTARQKLVQELGIELGPRRDDRQRPPPPKLLRPLGEACSAAGFGKWLCRDGGVIARRIEMLTQASSLEERESRPVFTEFDFLPEPRFCSHRDNSEQVVELIHELEDDRKLREQAADELNTALESAIVELTGLSGANLRKVFDQIRSELALRGQRLLLFIEDVSAMAELDTEVINALEPQDRLDLCPMTAMLGMTRVGFERLRDNQKGRLQIVVTVGDKSGQAWSDDAEELNRFAARYLNALRLPEDRVRSLSEQRRKDGGDVSISACSNCRVRESCHERFGKVTLQGGVDVGLYPLSPDATHALLQRLEVDEANAIARTPRGFLLYLLKPLIERPDVLERGQFPDLTQMPVRTTDPEYWTQFQQQYCGGWPDAERDRLRTLAVFWIGSVASADAAARALTPLLEPLKFRPFSRATKKPPTEPKPIESPVPPRGTPKPQEDTQKRLDSKKLQDLRDWLDRGTGLKFVTEWRTSLAVMIKESIRWEDRSDTPMSEVRRHLDGYKFISIADQGVESATASLSIEFPRTEETRALLEALARYQHQGGKTWNFDGGVLHRRVVSRWLRHNSDDIARYFQPNISGGTIAPVQTATQLLCLASLIRRRSRLPNVNADLLQELLKDSFPESTLVLSARLRKLIDDLRLRCVDIREKLFNEVVVPQGRTGGINFIDPREIVKTAQAFRDDPRIVALDEAYDRGLWQSRFYGLNGLSAYSELSAVVEEERTAIGKLLADIREFLSRQGYEVSDMSTAWGECCRDLKDLVVAADKDFFVSPALRELTRSDVFATARAAEVGAMLRRAEELDGSDNIADVVVFSSGQLSEVAVKSKRLDQELGNIADELSLQETHLQSAGGDPVELHRAFLSTLEAFDVVNDSAPLTDSEGAADDSDE